MPPIAEMNMGYLLHPPGDPRIAEFENNSPRINAIADRSPGFVWRMKPEDENRPENDAGLLFGRPDVALATLSVWESLDDFRHFVFQTVHGHFLNRRVAWFEPMTQPSYVIWPVAPGHIPTLAEGKERLLLLRAQGASDAAYDFSFRH